MGAVVAAFADRIELELRRIGRWGDTPPAPERMVDMGAFGMKKLAAEEWIQFVLVPRLRDTEHPPPDHSDVSTWATRQFDGDDAADTLLTVLRELDGVIESKHGVLGTVELAREACAKLPMVSAAYLVQLHAPHTLQDTTPILALELTDALPAEAFAGWSADHPMVVLGLSDDPLSRLVRLTPPIYTRSS